ncbi:ATP-grasp domain-containing protein [Acinetobacter pseudolwoffii]|uniref:ATP-grasp domain-containing protein n=1 Tax=Acinetobacter pseudolwoffii TaxID=2053287 RepID=UPI00257707A9|nr:hypothetical protein [Acinetobacter pseudolwoffii]MDM1341442.1 hypothetical protein [Acinetobacter pseudolwoffii]
MKIAIHHRSGSFSEHWINYCKKNAINFKLVNAFDSNIIDQLKGFDVFMWHHHHGQVKDILAAKKILLALQHAGIKVFPDFNTGWHFDDKVAQKYLLEAIDAPLVPSYVFYDRKQALIWARETNYPKVFKLKGGAGATNVKLVKSYSQAISLINQAFGRGFPQFDKWNNFREKVFHKNFSLKNLIKATYRLFILPDISKIIGPEKGYIYFQEFIPNNQFDTRVVVINGNYATAENRIVRKNDFRASGSGQYNYENINMNIIENSFKIAKELKFQSVAFDYILDANNNPLIIEICYGFGTQGIKAAPGYWDDSLTWYTNKFEPERLILEGILGK